MRQDAKYQGPREVKKFDKGVCFGEAGSRELLGFAFCEAEPSARLCQTWLWPLGITKGRVECRVRCLAGF